MNDSPQLRLIDSRNWTMRALLALAILAALISALYGAARQFGRAATENYQPAAENARETVALALKLAPGDAQTQLIAAKATKSFQFGKSARDAANSADNRFENAVRAAPQDYRWWLELGRSREQAGDRRSGEAALRRAVALAPNYAFPRWLLGNLLLRDAREAEAYAELKLAAENHSSLRQQVFYLVWETTGGDAQKIKEMFGDTAQVRAALATFYAGKKLPAESIQVWQSLSPEEKTEHRQAAETALQLNYDNYNFAAVAIFARDLEREAVEPNKITNAGFETEIGAAQDQIFNWRIEQLKNVDLALDPRQPREGRRSLRLTFKGFNEASLQAAAQTVVVEPKARYRLTFWYKTADLKSAGTPFLEIVEAKSGKTLGATQPFAVGSSDWQMGSVEFVAPADASGVFVRTARQFCGADCPIVGVLWYDDFKLERFEKNK